MAEKKRFMKQIEYARFIKKDKSQVSRYAQDGIVILNEDGLVDVEQSEINRRSHFEIDEDGNGKAFYDRLKSKIQAELLALDLDERKKDLIPKHIVEDQAFKVGKIIQSGLGLLETTYSRELFECETQKELESVLKKHITKILNDLQKEIKEL